MSGGKRTSYRLLELKTGGNSMFPNNNENIRPRGTSYSISGVSSNGLSRGSHSVKSLDPYSVLISLSVIDLSIVVCIKR